MMPTTANPHSANQAPRRSAIVILRAMIGIPPVVAIALLTGCGQREYIIPAVDGPLVLDLRYPTTAPVAVTDSIALWGTVGSGKATLSVNGQSIRVEPNGGFAAFVPLPAGDSSTLELEARKGSAVLRRSTPITRLHATPAAPAEVHPARGWVRLRRLPSDTVDSATQARPVYARWTPGGALALPLPLGVRLPIEAATDSALRLTLARGITVWVTRAEAEPVSPPQKTPVRLGGLSLDQTATRSMIALRAAELLPVTVEVIGDSMRWTLFGAGAEQTQPLNATEGLVRRVALRDAGDGRVIVDLVLSAPPLGWRTRWSDGRAVLEVRPAPDSSLGLKGLVVALDPGHPPQGAVGPTGLTEDSLTLAVALKAAERLRALGAQPILIRSDANPVSLEERVARAMAADAQLFVSVHANAPGDGRPPWSVDGTRIYWFNVLALPLANALEDSVAAALRQLTAGTIQSNLAVLRPTWFPAVLIEATALSLPAREAYLRSPEGIAGYAGGIVSGIQAWIQAPR